MQHDNRQSGDRIEPAKNAETAAGTALPPRNVFAMQEDLRLATRLDLALSEKESVRYSEPELKQAVETLRLNFPSVRKDMPVHIDNLSPSLFWIDAGADRWSIRPELLKISPAALETVTSFFSSVHSALQNLEPGFDQRHRMSSAFVTVFYDMHRRGGAELKTLFQACAELRANGVPFMHLEAAVDRINDPNFKPFLERKETRSEISAFHLFEKALRNDYAVGARLLRELPESVSLVSAMTALIYPGDASINGITTIPLLRLTTIGIQEKLSSRIRKICDRLTAHAEFLNAVASHCEHAGRHAETSGTTIPLGPAARLMLAPLTLQVRRDKDLVAMLSYPWKSGSPGKRHLAVVQSGFFRDESDPNAEKYGTFLSLKTGGIPIAEAPHYIAAWRAWSSSLKERARVLSIVRPILDRIIDTSWTGLLESRYGGKERLSIRGSDILPRTGEIDSTAKAMYSPAEEVRLMFGEWPRALEILRLGSDASKRSLKNVLEFCFPEELRRIAATLRDATSFLTALVTTQDKPRESHPTASKFLQAYPAYTLIASHLPETELLALRSELKTFDLKARIDYFSSFAQTLGRIESAYNSKRPDSTFRDPQIVRALLMTAELSQSHEDLVSKNTGALIVRALCRTYGYALSDIMKHESESAGLVKFSADITASLEARIPRAIKERGVLLQQCLASSASRLTGQRIPQMLKAELLPIIRSSAGEPEIRERAVKLVLAKGDAEDLKALSLFQDEILRREAVLEQKDIADGFRIVSKLASLGDIPPALMKMLWEHSVNQDDNDLSAWNEILKKLPETGISRTVAVLFEEDAAVDAFLQKSPIDREVKLLMLTALGRDRVRAALSKVASYNLEGVSEIFTAGDEDRALTELEAREENLLKARTLYKENLAQFRDYLKLPDKVLGRPTLKNFYAVLGAPRDATRDQIETCKIILTAAFHPDRFVSEKTRADADRITRDVAEAYANLIDTASRSEFDSNLQKYGLGAALYIAPKTIWYGTLIRDGVFKMKKARGQSNTSAGPKQTLLLG